MITSSVQPTEGQFVRLWEFNGKVWSDVCKFKDGELFVFDGIDDSWVLIEVRDVPLEINMTYIVKA